MHVSICMGKSIRIEMVNSYKPNVAFVGHRKTVHIQIRRDRPSVQGLHCLLTEYSIKILITVKNTTQQLLKRKWIGPIDEIRKFHSA